MAIPVSKKNSRLFWITFVIFLGLALSPAIIMFDQIKAEVGYWFSSYSTATDRAEDLGSIEETAAPAETITAITKIDRDRDGLPDYLETSFFHTDPLKADSDGDNYSDKEEIYSGHDPLSTYQEIVDKDRDLVRDDWEINRYGTDPNNFDTDGDGVGDGEEIMSGSNPLDEHVIRINPDLETYYLAIDKIGTKAPIVFVNSRDERAIYDGLKQGYVHYDDTALPGENGDAAFFCHSSSRIGSQGDYDTLCATLDKLDRGDEITIASESVKLRYRVTSRKNDYDPADPNIFRKTSRPSLSIVSCYPVGTNHQRIVVRAELVSL